MTDAISKQRLGLLNALASLDACVQFLIKKNLECEVGAVEGLSGVSRQTMLQLAAVCPDIVSVSWKQVTHRDATDPFAPKSKTAQPSKKLMLGIKGAIGVAAAKRRLDQARHCLEQLESIPEGLSVPDLQGDVVVAIPEPKVLTGHCNFDLAKIGTTPEIFDPEAVVSALKQLPFVDAQLTHVHHLPRRTAQFKDLEGDLPESLRRLLETKGIIKLFSHQVDSISATKRGLHVLLSTATSSGKSLAFTLPTIEAILTNRHSTAMFLYPTKALAQDQMRTLRDFNNTGLFPPIPCSAYDGDATEAQREFARIEANIILTNPDIIHRTLLGQHRSWSRVIKNLRFIVLDEAHTYRGTFGSHVSNVLRRLIRVCMAHGNRSIQFICCSATLANPAEFFTSLLRDLMNVSWQSSLLTALVLVIDIFASGILLSEG